MLETLNTALGNVPLVAVAAVVAGLLRATAGWLENALRDGKIDELEWKQLGGTVVQYFSYIMLLMLGVQPASEAIGNPITQTAAVSLATTVAFVLESLRTSLANKNSVIQVVNPPIN